MMIFIVWIAFILLQQKSKLESHRRVYENYYNIIMPSEDTKILEFNQYQKSDKTPSISYVDLECIIEKSDGLEIIMKIHLHQKQANTFHQIFQFLQYLHLEAQKISMI